MPHSVPKADPDKYSNRFLKVCKKYKKTSMRFDQTQTSNNLNEKIQMYRFHIHMIERLGKCEKCIEAAKKSKGVVISDCDMSYCYILCDDCLIKFDEECEKINIEAELSVLSDKLKI